MTKQLDLSAGLTAQMEAIRDAAVEQIQGGKAPGDVILSLISDALDNSLVDDELQENIAIDMAKTVGLAPINVQCEFNDPTGEYGVGGDEEDEEADEK